MAFPAAPLDFSILASGSTKIGAVRPLLKSGFDALNEVIDSFGVPEGICPLDVGGKVFLVNLPVGDGAGTIAAGDHTHSGFQTSHVILSAFTTLAPTAGQVPIFTAADALDLFSVSEEARPFLAETTLAGMRAALELTVGEHVLEFSPVLEAIADLAAGNGYLKRTDLGWTTIDEDFITGNETINIEGDVQGSGTTSINVTLPTIFGSPGVYGSANTVPQLLVNEKGQVLDCEPIPISIAESQIVDGSLLARLGAAETVTGTWTFANDLTVSTSRKLVFSQSTGLKMLLWGDPGSFEYSLGIQSGTLYQRSGQHFFWFVGGTHAAGAGDPGVGGTSLMGLNTAGLNVYVPFECNPSVAGDLNGASGISSTTTVSNVDTTVAKTRRGAIIQLFVEEDGIQSDATSYAVTEYVTSGRVATLTIPGHPFIVGDVIQISGSTVSTYDGGLKITSLLSGSKVTADIGIDATTPYTGGGVAKKYAGYAHSSYAAYHRVQPATVSNHTYQDLLVGAYNSARTTTGGFTNRVFGAWNQASTSGVGNHIENYTGAVNEVVCSGATGRGNFTSLARGAYNHAQLQNGQNILEAIASHNHVDIAGAGGRVATAYCNYNEVSYSGSLNLTTLYGSYTVFDPASAIKIGWYSLGEDYNLFSGKVRVGDTTLPEKELEVAGDALVTQDLTVEGVLSVKGRDVVVDKEVTGLVSRGELGSAAYMDVAQIPMTVWPKAISGAYTIQFSDQGKTLLVSGTTTLTLPSAARVYDLNQPWSIRIKATAGAVVTVARAGSDTIETASANLNLSSGVSKVFFPVSGSAWETV